MKKKRFRSSPRNVAAPLRSNTYRSTRRRGERRTGGLHPRLGLHRRGNAEPGNLYCLGTTNYRQTGSTPCEI